MKLIDLIPLKEGSAQARELADYNSLEQLQAMYDQLMRDMEQEAEPEGGPIADQYADQMQDIEDAMQIKRGGSGGEMTYDDMLKKHYPGRSNRPPTDKFTEPMGEQTLNEALQVTTNDGTVAMIEDPRDIEDFITGKGIVYGENEDGEVIELHINNSADYQHVANEELKENPMFATPKYIEGSLENATIEYGGKVYTDIYFEANEIIDDHGNEGKDMNFVAEGDGLSFSVDVSVDWNYADSGNIQEVYWDTLKAHVEGMEEGSCGYTHTSKGKELDTPGGTKGMDPEDRTKRMVREYIKKILQKEFIFKKLKQAGKTVQGMMKNAPK